MGEISQDGKRYPTPSEAVETTNSREILASCLFMLFKLFGSLRPRFTLVVPSESAHHIGRTLKMVTGGSQSKKKLIVHGVVIGLV